MNCTNLLKKTTHRDFNGGDFDYYGKHISCRLSNIGDVIVDIYDDLTHAATLCLCCDARSVEVSGGTPGAMVAGALSDLYRDKWTCSVV